MCTYEDLVAATLPLGLAPAGRAAAEDDHRRRRGDRAAASSRRRSATACPRDDRRDGRAHRCRRGRHRDARTASTPICSTDSRTRTEPWATPPGCGSSSSRSSRSSRCGTCGSPDRRRCRRRSTRSSTTGQHDGVPVDYLDGVVFTATESYLTLGTRTDEPGPTSDYTGRQIYYRSIQQRTTDRLTIHDYLWRWDTDWFWCSRAFGAQQPVVRRLWPKRLLRSSFYWKLVALDRRFDIADRLEAPAPPAAAGAGGAGHRGAGRADRGVRRLVPGRPCPSNRSGCARCDCRPNPRRRRHADLAAVPDRAGADLRQRRFLVGRADRSRASPTARPTG